MRSRVMLAVVGLLWCACVGVAMVVPPPPHSVVSVRYEGGHVTELRVVQDGAPVGDYAPASWPSLSDRRRSCTELCRAGMGGEPCGDICHDLLPELFREVVVNDSSRISPEQRKPKKILHFPVIHKNSTHDKNVEQEKEVEKEPGRPRYDVCPVLCENNLGYPICGCRSLNNTVEWASVCSAFCKSGSYILPGCPRCQPLYMDELAPEVMMLPNEYIMMEDMWVEWCKCQCRKGEGGAACNCDLIPFRVDDGYSSPLQGRAVQC